MGTPLQSAHDGRPDSLLVGSAAASQTESEAAIPEASDQVSGAPVQNLGLPPAAGRRSAQAASKPAAKATESGPPVEPVPHPPVLPELASVTAEPGPARQRPSRSAASSASRASTRLSADSIGWYLGTIGRVPLLTAAEEIELAHHVQAGKQLHHLSLDERTGKQKRIIRMGQRARDRMMAANLRLVVSVAKKYQNQGLELLDQIGRAHV